MNASRNPTATAFSFMMFYGIYGSVVGAAVLLFFVMPLTEGLGRITSVFELLKAIALVTLAVLWSLPVALVLGALPGTVTGLVFWWLRTRTTLAGAPLLTRV